VNGSPLTSHTFDWSEHERFARLSGDFNPMHMDRVAARRTQAGAPVVHGVHGLLWALDQLARAGYPVSTVAKIEVQFTKFLYLDRQVTLRVLDSTAAALRAELVMDGLAVTILVLRFGSRNRNDQGSDFSAFGEAEGSGDSPRVLELSELPGMTGWVSPAVDPRKFRSAFPDVFDALGPSRLAEIACVTRLVGMVCPGLHSIFAALTIEITEGPVSRAGIGFLVEQAHAELRAVRMRVVGSGLQARVRAMVRWPPIEAPSVRALSPQVTPGEFANTRALIVGGSRGLGAVTAKLIAAGGGCVTVTYAAGQADAETLMQEVNSTCGVDICKAFRLDVCQAVAPQLEAIQGEYSHLYYFATPQIFKQDTEVFNSEQFSTFRRFYVDGFYEIYQWVQAASNGALSVLWPSSIAVETQPDGMLEYIMAKAAGEALCAGLIRAAPGLRILTPRLPRTLTDQTATVVRVQNADPVDVMLPLIRTMHHESKPGQ
jgi:hypothetical protein